MKNTITILGLFVSIVLTAQNKKGDDINDATASPKGDVLRNTNVVQAMKADYSDIAVQGSPYYEENYKEADIYINKEFNTKYLARYNAVKDEIEIYKDNLTFALLKREDFETVFAKYRYKILEYEGAKGYYIVFNDFDKTTLLLKPKKNFKEGQEPKSSYGSYIPPKFVEDYKYYIRSQSGSILRIKLKKKEILKVLENKKNEVENFVSSGKLNYKKKEDVIKIIDYYNTL